MSTATAAPTLAVGTIVVAGAVASPTSFTATDLAAQPTVTVPTGRGGTINTGSLSGERSITGVPLQSLITRAAPTFDNGKNAVLRIAVTVRGVGRAVTFALGELDPGFGNHPAVLRISTGPLPRRTDLIVPGDTTAARSVVGVYRIDVAVTPPGPPTASAGTINVIDNGRSSELTAATLASLPQMTQRVTFVANGVSTSRTFRGPDLLTALRTIRVVPSPFSSTITATGTDGYAAAVTPGEPLVGSRPLLLALSDNGTPLARPRLVPTGDVKGGRYITDTASLTVTAH